MWQLPSVRRRLLGRRGFRRCRPRRRRPCSDRMRRRGRSCGDRMRRRGSGMRCRFHRRVCGGRWGLQSCGFRWGHGRERLRRRTGRFGWNSGRCRRTGVFQSAAFFPAPQHRPEPRPPGRRRSALLALRVQQCCLPLRARHPCLRIRRAWKSPRSPGCRGSRRREAPCWCSPHAGAGFAAAWPARVFRAPRLAAAASASRSFRQRLR